MKRSIEYRFGKLKIFVLASLFLMIFNQLESQNLVQNPSFEEFVDFKTDGVKGCWHKIQSSDTPDYFNLSESNSYNNIFTDFVGGTKPKSGNSFIGIFCYRVQLSRNIKNIREYIETSLLNKLEKDSIYKVEISLCLDKESNFAIKNFGVFFSDTSFQFNKDFKTFSVNPQVEFNSSFLDSTNSWIELRSFYKAGGFEKLLTIGNFNNDKATIIKSIKPLKERGKSEKWNLTKKEKAAYYYIDDVIVEKVTINKAISINSLNDEKVVMNNDKAFNINEIKVDSSVILKNIIFEFNKSDLLSQSFNEINKLYQLMIINPDIRIKLEGHTDNIGGYDFNLQLSIRRVESVTKYLINKGINPCRIEYAGYSFLYPLESNETDNGRQINRRVAFKIIQK